MKPETQLWQEKRFDDLYTNFPDPWGCEKNVSSFSNSLFAFILHMSDKKYKRILDIGCGKGAKTHFLFRMLNPLSITGIDVSKVAIQDAREKNKNTSIDFIVKDVSKDEMETLGKFDLVVCSEILWYVCEDVYKVMLKIQSMLSEDGVLAIQQFFPVPQNFYNEYINGMEEFNKLMNQNWEQKRMVVSTEPSGLVLFGTYKRKEA